MKPWVKLVVGVLSHLPAAYILFFMSFFVWMLSHMISSKAEAAHPPMASLFLAHVVVILVLLAFYVLWLLKGSRLTLEGKLLWAVGLTFMAPVVMPVLYWVYVRRIPAGPYYLGLPFNKTRAPQTEA